MILTKEEARKALQSNVDYLVFTYSVYDLRDLYERLSEQRKEDITIFLKEHDLQIVEESPGRFVVLPGYQSFVTDINDGKCWPSRDPWR